MRGAPGEEGNGGAAPTLHVVTPAEAAAAPDFADAAERLFRAGGDRVAVHLRLLDAPDREWLEAARTVRARAERHGGWCVVNDRVDVAAAAGVRAVQLGGRSLPLAAARRVLGEAAILGRSVHGTGEAREAAARGANFLLLGTIFATPSHPGRRGAGPEAVAACAGIGVPLIAIGGITAERVAAVRAAGAAGIAVQRAVWEADEPAAAAADLLRAWDAAASG